MITPELFSFKISVKKMLSIVYLSYSNFAASVRQASRDIYMFGTVPVHST